MSEHACGHVMREGRFGATAEDEVPNQLCPKPATWRVYRPAVRPRYRCAVHVATFRDLPFSDLVIEALEPGL